MAISEIAKNESPRCGMPWRVLGDDGGRFWALHSSVWPKFGKPMRQPCDDMLGTTDEDEIAAMDATWRFVSEGVGVMRRIPERKGGH